MFYTNPSFCGHANLDKTIWVVYIFIDGNSQFARWSEMSAVTAGTFPAGLFFREGRMRPKSVFAVMHGDVLWNSVLKAFYSGAYLQKPDSPNFNPAKLVKETCTLLAHQFMNQYNLTKFHFYVTNKDDEAKSTGLWDKLLRSMPNLCKNIDYKDYTYCYPVEDAYNRNGAYFRGYTKINPRIHVQMALDLVLGAINKEYDATLLFVDNPVYLEVVSAVKIIAKNQQRFVEIFVAHPVPPEQLFSDRVQEILLNRELYNRCIL